MSSTSRAIIATTSILLACSTDQVQQGATELERIGSDALIEVGTSEAITKIVDLAEGPDGTIWILNSMEPYFIAMDPDGETGRTWGRRGGGPGEFRNPNVLVAQESGAVWVFDRGRHAFARIDGPEDPIEIMDVPRESMAPGQLASTENAGSGSGGRLWIRSMPSGFAFARGGAGTTIHLRLWTADLVLVREGRPVEILFPGRDRLGDPASRYGDQATEFLPYPLFALCADRTVALYDPLTNSVRRFSENNEMLDSIPLPPERALEITMDRIFRMAFQFVRDQAPAGQKPDSATLYAQLSSQWGTMQGQASPVFPEYGDLQCSGVNSLWLQRFDPDRGTMGRSPVWLRITEGAIRSYEFPEAFQPLRFQSNRVLGIQRGEFDIESVAWLTLPGER